VFITVVHLLIDSVRKLLDTPSYFRLVWENSGIVVGAERAPTTGTITSLRLSPVISATNVLARTKSSQTHDCKNTSLVEQAPLPGNPAGYRHKAVHRVRRDGD